MATNHHLVKGMPGNGTSGLTVRLQGANCHHYWGPKEVGGFTCLIAAGREWRRGALQT